MKGDLIPPRNVGDKVACRGYGGEVQSWMTTGTVVRFNRNGWPVIDVDACHGRGARTVTDRYFAFALADENGKFVRSES